MPSIDETDIQGATDEELLNLSRPTTMERLLPQVMTPLTSVLFVVLVGVISYFTFTDGSEGNGPLIVGIAIIVLTIGLGITSIMAGTLYLLDLPERRSALQRAELVRRYGQAGFDEDLREAIETEDREDAPHYTIYLSGQEMPSTKKYWIRLDLDLEAREGAGLVQVESRVGLPIDFHNDPQPLVDIVRRRVSYELSPGADLLEFLEELDLNKLRSVKSCYINGMPCEIALIRRGSKKVYRGGCNYVEQDDRVKTAPVMRLAGILLNIMRAQTSKV